MPNQDHVEATCIIPTAGLPWLPEPLHLRLTLSPLVLKQQPVVVQPFFTTAAHLPPYTRKYSVSLSEENWQQLHNLSYWLRGQASSKVAIINRALALYLAIYEESTQPIPLEEEEGL